MLCRWRRQCGHNKCRWGGERLLGLLLLLCLLLLMMMLLLCARLCILHTKNLLGARWLLIPGWAAVPANSIWFQHGAAGGAAVEAEQLYSSIGKVPPILAMIVADVIHHIPGDGATIRAWGGRVD